MVMHALVQGEVMCRQNTFGKHMFMCMSGEISVIYDPEKARQPPRPRTSDGEDITSRSQPHSPVSAASRATPHSPDGDSIGAMSPTQESFLMRMQRQESMRIRAKKEAEAEKRNIPIGFRGLDDIMVAVFKEVDLPPVEGPEFLGETVSKLGVGRIMGHVSALTRKPLLFSARAAINSTVLMIDARLCKQICTKEQIEKAEGAAFLHNIECFTRFPENSEFRPPFFKPTNRSKPHCFDCFDAHVKTTLEFPTVQRTFQKKIRQHFFVIQHSPGP